MDGGLTRKIPKSGKGPAAGDDVDAGKEKEAPGQAGRASSRIRQTAQRILLEAARALAREPVPRKRADQSALRNAPLYGLEHGLTSAEREQLVEIVDADDRPLAVMAPQSALRQGLRFRKIAVVLRPAPDTVLIIRKRDERTGRPGLWNIGSGVVRVGEAREDAAARLMAEEAGLGGIRPRMVAVAGEREGFAYDLALFVADLPKGFLPWREDIEAVVMDRDELEGVIEGAEELFTPELRWAARTGGLFDG